MRCQILAIGLLIANALLVGGCTKRRSSNCFDRPESFSAELENDATKSLKKGATAIEVHQFCSKRELSITQSDSSIYCTAEEHRGLSRCSVVLQFELGGDETVKTIRAGQPEIKNP